MVGCFFKKVFSQKLFDFDVYFCFSCYVILISFFSLKMNFSYCKKKKKLILQPYQKPIRCAFAFNSQTEPQGEIANMVDMGVVVIIKCKQTRVSRNHELYSP